MNRYLDDMEEEIPQIVEKKLQDSYEMIRSGEIKQIQKQNNTGEHKRSYGRMAGMAAALALIVAVPSVTFAAITYFQKSVRQTEDSIVYEFKLNYDLTPGEYEVLPQYLPEGMTLDANSYNKYKMGDKWISLLPVTTMKTIERMEGQISAYDVENVEHMVLSGMPADVITFREAEKYQKATYIILFNEKDGYLVEILADYGIPHEEVLKFADNLRVEKTGDGNYMTDNEKLKQKQDDIISQKAKERMQELFAAGIPNNKIFKKGEELISSNKAYEGDGASYGYTVTDYEFLDSISGFSKEYFFDYGIFNGRLNADNTLKPYTRQEYSADGQLSGEKQTEQKILKVNIKVRNYSKKAEYILLNFNLQYVEKTPGGAYTWSQKQYSPVPAENYMLQLDESAIYCDKAVNIKDNHAEFFFRQMEPGEELEYTLLFVVDADRVNDFMMAPEDCNNSWTNTQALTASEILEGLEGYISLH